VACVLAIAAGPAARQDATVDPWDRVRVLVGEWEGAAEGQAGSGVSRRTYAFVLGGRFLHEKNVSTYPAQEKNKTGEVHEHWSIISYDRARRVLVLRQFHQEGFVNQYVLDTARSTPEKLVFDSERFENLADSWRARETYDIRSADEFVETFEVAAPGEALEVYSRTRFTRVKR